MVVQIVLARNCLGIESKIKVRLVFWHTPDTFASLYGYLRANRKVVHVLAHVVLPLKDQWKNARCLLRSMGHSNGNTELDVPADIGRSVINYSNHQNTASVREQKR